MHMSAHRRRWFLLLLRRTKQQREGALRLPGRDPSKTAPSGDRRVLSPQPPAKPTTTLQYQNMVASPRNEDIQVHISLSSLRLSSQPVVAAPVYKPVIREPSEDWLEDNGSDKHMQAIQRAARLWNSWTDRRTVGNPGDPKQGWR